MKEYILETPITNWICRFCGLRDATKQANIHTRYHQCLATGLTTPMVDIKLDCKVEMQEREDYIGEDIVQTNKEGRPIMAVKTTRSDGEDVVVYAPTVVKVLK